MRSTLAQHPACRNRRSWNWPVAHGSISITTAACWGVREQENLNQHNTPLVTELCSGSVAVTDPTHPLYGREFQVAGIARLPGYRRYYQVAIFSDEFTYIPIDATDHATSVRPPSSLLTFQSIGWLVDTFQRIQAGRTRDATETSLDNASVGQSSAGSASSGGATDRTDSPGGRK